ncbi:hypothetical protein [Spirabiliibacterium falconis]|uniref:hypothetical protein n=1 Tax=Spirabiliibacterium falconis TaxID=572023 RepID=UPI001AAD87CB|nr:hypothetical protein [Spirabiliibacterium falconis]MBE2894809.1 hypothetical protein [Spirabiliibacterium falconis]
MRYFFLLTAFFLSACSTTSSIDKQQGNANSARLHFLPPSQLTFANKTFVRGKTVDLIEMQKYVYRPTTKGVLKEKVTLFFDQNRRNMSLQQRLALRQRSYQRSHTQADLHLADESLYSTVIYRPSQQFRTWGVEVTKGRNIAKCGFLEVQYSYALNPNRTVSDATVVQQTIAPYAHHIMQQLKRQPWQWRCS